MKHLLTITSVFVLLYSCDINEPKLASWDTSWKVHLRGDVVTMSELLDDSSIRDSLDAGSGEELFYFSKTDSSEKKAIDREQMAFKGEDRHFTKTIGVFGVDQPQPQATPAITFADAFAAYNPQAGMTLPPIAPFTLQPDRREVSFDEFRELHIESATMTLVFYNDMIVGIDEGLQIILFDKARQHESDGGVIDTFYFDQPIPPGTSQQSNTMDLAGKVLSNNLELEYTVPVSGTTSPMVLSEEDLNGGFYSEVQMSQFQVRRALAKIPQQQISRNDASSVNSSDHRIRRAMIEEGKLYLSIRNNMNIGGQYDLVFNNFLDEYGNPKTRQVNIVAQSDKQFSIDLNGYSLESGDGTFLDEIEYELSVTTEETHDYVWVDSEDSMAVSVSMDSLYFSRFEGELAQTEITFDPVRQTDLLSSDKFDGALTLPDLVLQFDFHNEINFDVDVQLRVTGIKHDDAGQVMDSVALTVNETINRATFSKKAVTSLLLDKNSSSPNIVDLMAIMPDEMVVSGSARIAGDGSVDAGQKVWVNYRLESPLTVNITEKMTYNGNVQVIDENDVSQEERDKVIEKLSRISLNFNTLNGLPLASRVKIFFAADSNDLFDETIIDSTQKVILTAEIKQPQIDGDGFVSQPTDSELLFLLSSREMEVFENTTVYTAIKAEIDPTGEAVRFRPADELYYEGVISFDAVVDPENF